MCFVRVRTKIAVNIITVGVSEKFGVDYGQDGFGDFFRVGIVLGVVTFLEGVIHCVDGDFAFFVAIHCVDVGLLDEEEDKEEGRKGGDDEEFWDGEAEFVSFLHIYIIA